MASTSSSARLPQLTIREVKTSAVEVPMTYPLGTSAATVRRAPLLLIDLETEGGGDGTHLPVLLSPERTAGHRRGAPRRCRPLQERDRGAARHRSQAR
jgi:hypothetical protein